MIYTNKRNFLIKITALASILYTSSLSKIFASWPKDLFHSKNSDNLIKLITDGADTIDTDSIIIKAPEIAENGAVVPISVDTKIENVKNIAILVDNNPSPLTSTFEINPQLEAYVSTRVKMAKSSNIIALVATNNNEFYTASKSIKVTIGGCGG